MAGERKGKTYEAIVKVALEELKSQGKLKGEIFWNETPAGMTIEPDFTVGPDKDHPDVVFLITHSGAAGNSHMKFWRNMGELAEAKVRLPKPPRVYSIAFDSVIKEDLKKLQDAAFDGQLIVGDTDYGREVQTWVDASHARLPKQAEDKALAVREEAGPWMVTTKSKSPFGALTQNLDALVTQTKPALDGLWIMARQRRVGRVQTARETFVRRGVIKMLLLPKNGLAAVLAGRGSFTTEQPFGAAFTLGLVGPWISKAGAPTNYRVRDPEILNAVAVLKREPVSYLIGQPRSAGFQAVIEQVESVGILDVMLDAVVAHYAQLTSPAGMLRALEEQYDDPRHLLPVDLPRYPNDVWMFRVVADLVKSLGDRKQGYGYAQFVQDVKRQAASKELKHFVSAAIGEAGWTLPASTEPIRRGLQDYLNRIPGRSFSRSLLAVTAFVLAGRLAGIRRKDLTGLKEKLVETWKSSALEARLLAHRAFDPVGMLVKRALAGCAPREVYLPACYAEAAGVLGSELTGTTKVFRANDAIVNWQSVTDAGRDHKKKELCGRAVALRYSWDPKSKRFIPRPGVKKLILVVDGTWRQDDLDALVAAGWDEIYYPDEMDKLAAAIV